MKRILVIGFAALSLAACQTSGGTTPTGGVTIASVCSEVAALSGLASASGNADVTVAIDTIIALCAATSGGTALTATQATTINTKALVLRQHGVIK